MRRAAVVFAVALLLAGCGKKTGAGSDASVTGVASAPAPSAVASATPSANASASASTSSASYTGNYALSPGQLHIPESKDYAHVKQAKDDPSKLVGPGTLTLTVGGDGKVAGEIDTGPASPALISGTVVDGEIRGFVRRKTPSDDGLTGTLVAKIAGAGGEGKVTLAEANASILREGTVTLTPKK